MQQQEDISSAPIMPNGPRKLDILGVQVSVASEAAAFAAIERNLDAWRGGYVTACNVHAVILSQDDPAVRAAENGAVMALADGKPICLAQRKSGCPEAGHAPITSLMETILSASAAHGWRHYFYGSTAQTQSKLAARLIERYPNLCVVGGEPSLFRPLSSEETDALFDRVRAAQPDFLWVGLGVPRQELFMHDNAGRVDALMLGVGGGFDVLSGSVRRAPRWMQRCCLEWLYRLLQEPKRLFRRYFVTNTRFLWLMATRRGK